MNNNLIFDLGFHKGEDTKNYLKKGYNVIAVEANTHLYKQGLANFSDDIDNKLILINKAIYSTDNIILNFYINPNVSEWGSIKQDIAEQDKTESHKQSIETITFIELCKTYGVPYYCKVDIESADIFVALGLNYYKPQYISFELNQKDYFEFFYQLKKNGYEEFQLINQVNNKPYGSSGEFGEYLNQDKWINFDEALSRYIKFKELRNIDRDNLSSGWLDIHARRLV